VGSAGHPGLDRKRHGPVLEGIDIVDAEDASFGVKTGLKGRRVSKARILILGPSYQTPPPRHLLLVSYRARCMGAQAVITGSRGQLQDRSRRLLHRSEIVTTVDQFEQDLVLFA